MMLDPKRTFDELIDKVAADAGQAAEIKANRVYRELSTAVSGSQEFTAISKLYELSNERDFDLLVLDTPPTRNALDFFDAPGRLTSFLDGRALKMFLRPTNAGMRLLGHGAAPVMSVLSRITGIDLISDLSSFFQLLGGMTSDFSARAVEVERMLHAATTSFLLVTSAQADAIEEAIWFRRTLSESDLPFAGVVVNRYHHDLGADDDPKTLSRELSTLLDKRLSARVAANYADYRVLAKRDAENVGRLKRELTDEPVLLVPHLDDDVHDLDGLLLVARYLFATEAERAQLIDALVA
jgi:anion-transporting  ArsA/GET3 family ATPase